jgi:MOSC domain-containing protein YiiM
MRLSRVVAVHARSDRGVTKHARAGIALISGEGVAGDVHAGATARHRSRMKKDPTQPNLRQVHLIHAELFDELAARGLAIGPGAMGENVTTRGIDLLGLGTGARLRLGADAVVELTGLRNPCDQLEGVAPGLMAATLDRGPDGAVVGRRAGVMAIVVTGGEVRPGDPVAVEAAGGEPLRPV